MSHSPTAENPAPAPSSPWRAFLASLGRVAVVAHAGLAMLWGWFMPRGFPPADARFWVNQVLPLLVVLGVVIVIWRGWQRGGPWTLASMLFGTMWVSAAVASRVIFPVSTEKLFIVVLLVGAMLWIGAWATGWPRISWRHGSAIVAAATLGVWLPWSQRGPVPTTVPTNHAWPTFTVSSFSDRADPRVAEGVDLRLATSTVSLQRDAYTIDVDPLLTFISRSPDRCWTLLSPYRHRVAPVRVLDGIAETDVGEVAAYHDDAEHLLRVSAAKSEVKDTVDIEAHAKLPAAVFSHLNTFSLITLSGHASPWVSFSPTGSQRWQVTKADYPVGKPRRFAAMLPGNRFVVAEASSGEKGPFTILAEGRLDRGEPLRMTLYDGQSAIAQVTWYDFSSQASTARSPTAGWGMPQNAIELDRLTDRPDSEVSVYVTLAGTSLGRGFDSVGHAAGTYRNRMTVRWLTESSATDTQPVKP